MIFCEHLQYFLFVIQVTIKHSILNVHKLLLVNKLGASLKYTICHLKDSYMTLLLLIMRKIILW